jgi:hypothetical protein
MPRLVDEANARDRRVRIRRAPARSR